MRQIAALDPAQYSRLESAETEIERIAFHAGERERHAVGIAEGRQAVDERPAGVAEAEQLGNLVESLARRIVARTAQQPVRGVLARFEQVRVAAADDQGEGGEYDRIAALPSFQNDRVNVPLNVIHGDQRNAGRRTRWLSHR